MYFYILGVPIITAHSYTVDVPTCLVLLCYGCSYTVADTVILVIGFLRPEKIFQIRVDFNLTDLSAIDYLLRYSLGTGWTVRL